MRLRTKLAIVLLVVTVVLSGATYGGLEYFKGQQREDVRDDLTRATNLAAGGIEENVREKKNLVGYVTSRADREDLENPEPFANQFLRRSAQSNVFAVQVVDVDGTITAFESDGAIAESVLRENEGTSAADTDYYRCVVETGATCVTDVEEREGAAENQRYFVEVASPIILDGRMEGMFVAAVTLNRQSFFNPLTPLAGSEREVRVVADGTQVYGAGTATGSQITERATVESTGWQVYVARDASDLNSQLQFLGIAQGVGLFVVLSSIVGFGYWQYNTSMRQAERLVDAFERLQSGAYDHQIDLTAGEEWEEISEGYNRMSEGIRDREAKLRDRQQRLEVLYRVIRHNLRNEMSVILNYADIAGSMTENEQVEMAADTIADTGRKLTSLSEKARQIQNALDSADETEPIDVAEVARRTADEQSAEFPDVTVRTDVPETATAEASPALELAVENVVENAAKHDDSEDPIVDVSVGVGEDTVYLSVADGGPGIPEQERNVLTKGRETSLEHGSGLGLWLVYWVVDRSGGDLRFDDNEPRGSVVTVTLDPPSEPVTGAVTDGEATAAEATGADGETPTPADD
ncbi:sensor histidine kinase [Halobaculum sp. MBLA0147]|uniref:sensor histidine kinase n=1 Tax=Halobaculum sp. MBLA0147 TaxID=3079934 RepID=UPI003526618D